jgi:glutamate N-acetyltransferase/amino-acid N-acetyltransferase
MIGPAMATMLSVIATDYPLTPEMADSFLRSAVNQSFNRISVEGHTSTNDACILLAKPVSEESSPVAESSLASFRNTLHEMTLELAKKIPADGEGATHLIRIVVSGAATDADADRVARTIAMSNLVKTAVAGADPNWGRIVSAAGYAGVQLAVEEVSLRVNGLLLFTNGEPAPFDAAAASQSIRDGFDTLIELTIGQGAGHSAHYTSDLTADYVRLNADYTT